MSEPEPGGRLEDELASLRIDQSARREGRWAHKSRPSAGGKSHTDGNQRSPFLLPVVVFVGFGLLVGGWLVFHESQGRLFPEEVEVGAVTLMSPSVADVKLVATGYVVARKKATVAPKINGRVSRLLVDEGDLVKEGQVLAELETVEAQAQLAQIRADVAAAKARVERARTDVSDAQTHFGREKDLLARGAGTQSMFDDVKARLTSATAQLSAAEAEVHAVESRSQAVYVMLDATKVRAPFAGTIVRKIAEVGEVLPAGVVGVSGYAAGLFQLIDLTNLEVQADVAESQLGKVKIDTATEILLDAFPDRRFRGKVADIRRTVDRAKAAITVKVRFDGDVGGVLPDMAAKVSFLAKRLDDDALKAKPKLVAPADAVVERGGRKVLLSNDDGHVRELPVTVVGPLPSDSALVELSDGPATSTKVIRRPSAMLKEGMPVKERKK